MNVELGAGANGLLDVNALIAGGPELIKGLVGSADEVIWLGRKFDMLNGFVGPRFAGVETDLDWLENC